MTIGDYEWQTPSIIENTINVNLLGAMRVASEFLPDLRRNAVSVSNYLFPRIRLYLIIHSRSNRLLKKR